MPFADADVNDIFSITNCRVCLNPGDMQIFGSIDLSEHVIKFADIKIDEHDDFPKYICNDCNIMLGNAITFRKTAKASDRMLRCRKGFEKDESPMKYSDIDDEKSIVRDHFKIQFEEDNIFTKLEGDSDIDEKLSEIKNVEELEYDKTFYVLDSDLFREENFNDTEPDLPRQYLEFDETTSDEYDEDKISSDKYSINGDIEAFENFECNECDEIFKSSEEFEEHLLLQHDPRTSVKCEICDDMVDKTYYFAHVKHHQDKYKKQWERKYSKKDCKVCGTSVSKSYYKTHLKTHDKTDKKAKRRKVCPFCKKSYNIRYFVYHLKHMHNKEEKNEDHSPKPKEALEQELKHCPVCDKTIKKHSFKDHLATHGKPPKQYVCDQCGMVTIYPSAFKLHLMTHGAELKYKCQFCPYRALHNGLLKVHVRTHTKDYLYQCTECPARFINKSNLSMHQRKHRRTDDVKCDICNKSFYSKRNLKQHYNSIHLGIRDVKCDLCGKAFGNRNGMLNHQKKVHKRKSITNRVGRMPSYLKVEIKNTGVHENLILRTD